ncbi:MAG: peptidoglycan DD-metalloendopeptidase family protein [Bacillota bacterium]|jgi:murein DD-endopeptidase MepM/ murein hydrolase activator NlpD
MGQSIGKWVMTGTIIVALMSTSIVIAGSPKNEQSKIKKMINRTKQEIQQKRKKERSVLSNLIQHQKSLASLKRNYTLVNRQLVRARKKVTQTRRELSDLQSNIAVLEANLKSRNALLSKRLVAIYKYGPQNYLQMILSADSFGDLVSNFGCVAYFVRADLELLEKVKADRLELAKQQKEVERRQVKVENEMKEISVLQDKVSTQQRKVSAKLTSTQIELTKIKTDRARLERALDELEATSRKLEAQIRRSQSKGKLLGSGQLSWPVRGRISSPFGWRLHPILKRRKYHTGIDFAVPRGTPVKAADGGVVLVSGWRGGYGNFIAIDHGKGISTCYGHNSRLLVRAGQRVKKGQKIALSGSTGLSTGPHLHFEVRVNGNPVNPLGYL